LLPYNPAAGVRKPKASKREMHVLEPEQVGRFLAAAERDRLYAFYVVALDSGARLPSMQEPAAEKKDALLSRKPAAATSGE
jgi:hypothetical protein